MKSLKILLVITLTVTGLNVWSQIAINDNGTFPHESAMLDVQSSEHGLLIPRMLASQRDLISNPATGLMVYVTDMALFYYYDGSNWLPIGSGGSGGGGWIIDGSNMYPSVAGNIGIGTSLPDYKLTVDGGHGIIKGVDGWNSSGDQARLFLGDGYNSLFAVHSQGLRIRAQNNDGYSIRWGGNNGVDYMTLQMETGRLGIGTTSPLSKLDVRGWNPDDGAVVEFSNSDRSHKLALFSGRETDPNPFIQWSHGDPLRFCTDLNGWAERMRITTYGNIGIGTEEPATRLHISGPSAIMRGQFCITDDVGNSPSMTFYQGSDIKAVFGCSVGVSHWSSMDGSAMAIAALGNPYVGVGVDAPDVKLQVEGGYDASPVEGGFFQVGPSDNANIVMDDNEIISRNNGATSPLYINKDGGSTLLNMDVGYVGIGTDSPSEKLTVRGNILVESANGDAIVEIGEGLDYAEGFDVSNHLEAEPGTVLVLDPHSPGELMVSVDAYDTKVAGIVAGANSLGSGVKLGSGQFDCDVALAGRVYCKVDASYGEISVGDLLTTSPTPGHAMVVKDRSKAHGTILGKAMQSLEKGKKGQVLVLVTLQ
nr:hypothetical protein [Bacteroidota bacterium]